MRCYWCAGLLMKSNLDFSQMQRLLDTNLVVDCYGGFLECHSLHIDCYLTRMYYWIVFNLSIYTYEIFMCSVNILSPLANCSIGHST